MIVGFVRDNQGPDEDTQGYTYAGAPVTIVTETDPDAGATVAHEIAHVQPHAPQVEILAPTADEVVDGEYMIRLGRQPCRRRAAVLLRRVQ